MNGRSRLAVIPSNKTSRSSVRDAGCSCSGGLMKAIFDHVVAAAAVIAVIVALYLPLFAA
jgi:hypothetical protein